MWTSDRYEDDPKPDLAQRRPPVEPVPAYPSETISDGVSYRGDIARELSAMGGSGWGDRGGVMSIGWRG